MYPCEAAKAAQPADSATDYRAPGRGAADEASLINPACAVVNGPLLMEEKVLTNRSDEIAQTTEGKLVLSTRG